MIVNTLNENRPIIAIHEKQYYLDNLIAEGGYAMIYKIQSLSDEKILALKKINIQSSNHKKQIKREVKIWKELSKYGNIVELIDCEFTEKHAYIVMEYCEEGTLLDFVNNHEGNISEVEALLIFNQILLGVNSMHSQKPPIAHRDLKIENILKKKKNYKICDFGSASDEIFDPKNSDEFIKEQNFSNFEKHTTLYYRAPEMCDRYGEYIVSEKVDIWSLGCVLYTIVFKEQPFINAQKLEIINGNYNFPKDEQKLYSEKFLDLIRVMLTPNPNNRPSVLQIMEWTNYWNDTDKIPLSPEVEEIKKKQILSGGIKNKSHKKKLLSAEEIEKIQSKLKNKEKKKKAYDDINEIFGFTNKNEEEKKDDNNNNNTLNDDLFAVFSGSNQNQNNIKKENNNEDLLEFYEVDESQQTNTNNNNINNKNINNDLETIFANVNTNNKKNETQNKNNIDLLFNSTNETKKENNNEPNNTNDKKNEKTNNNNFDLLFNNTNEVKKDNKNEPNKMKKTDLNDLLNAINNENKKENPTNNDLFDMNANSGKPNNNKNEIIFKMNGQDLFSNFPSSEPEKKEEKEEKQKPKEEDLFTMFNKPEKKEEKNTKLEDDLFAAFSQPQNTPKEEVKDKKDEKKEQLENDLFATFNQPQKSQEKEKPKDEKKEKLEDDIFSAFSQPQNNKKEEEKKIKEIKNPIENDLFATFNQDKTNQKEEDKNKNVKLEDDLFSAFNQTQNNPKEDIKNSNKEDDLFSAFNQPKNNDKKEEIKKDENNNKILLEGINFDSWQNKPDKTSEEKKEIKNNIDFDIFNFGENNPKKDTTTNTNKENTVKDNNFDLLFSLNNLNNNENKVNGGDMQTENGQTQQTTSNNNDNSSSTNQNKNQDIFAFFQ